ncbi:glycosyltransferase [Subtercola sp. YIM 133946]|uniref:glycosyltransferase n=1 Tax=Subtercola sp. YIM 133946 TaxID=3118909 RepID=UPI002F91EE3B
MQQALAHGVPLIAAGDTEDKPEVCARITYSGVGIDLKTGAPDARQLGDALDRLLAEPGYRAAARRIAAAMRRHDALAEIAAEVETLAATVTARRGSAG